MASDVLGPPYTPRRLVQPNPACAPYFSRPAFATKSRCRDLLGALKELHLRVADFWGDAARLTTPPARTVVREPAYAGVSIQFLQEVARHLSSPHETVAQLAKSVLGPASRPYQTTFLGIPGLVHGKFLGAPDFVVACNPDTPFLAVVQALEAHAVQQQQQPMCSNPQAQNHQQPMQPTASAHGGQHHQPHAPPSPPSPHGRHKGRLGPTYWLPCFASHQHTELWDMWEASASPEDDRMHSARLAASSAQGALLLLDQSGSTLQQAWPLQDVLWVTKANLQALQVLPCGEGTTAAELLPLVQTASSSLDLATCQLPCSCTDQRRLMREFVKGLEAHGVTLQACNLWLRKALGEEVLKLNAQLPPGWIGSGSSNGHANGDSISGYADHGNKSDISNSRGAAAGENHSNGDKDSNGGSKGSAHDERGRNDSGNGAHEAPANGNSHSNGNLSANNEATANNDSPSNANGDLPHVERPARVSSDSSTASFRLQAPTKHARMNSKVKQQSSLNPNRTSNEGEAGRPGSSNPSATGSLGSPDAVAWLQSSLAMIRGMDAAGRLEGTMAIRKGLDSYHAQVNQAQSSGEASVVRGAVSAVIKAGMLPRMVAFLDDPDRELQVEACGVLANVCASCPRHMFKVVEAGAVSRLIRIMGEDSSGALYPAVRCLAYIAKEGEDLRNLVAGDRVASQLLEQHLSSPETLSLECMRELALLAAPLLQAWPDGNGDMLEPQMEEIQAIAGALIQSLKHFVDSPAMDEHDDVLLALLQALVQAADGDPEERNTQLLQLGLLSAVTPLIRHKDKEVVKNAVLLAGCLTRSADCSNNNNACMLIADCKLQTALQALLDDPSYAFLRREASWAMSNIMQCGQEVQEQVCTWYSMKHHRK